MTARRASMQCRRPVPTFGLAAFRADARVSAETSHTVLRRVAGLTLRNATEAGVLTEAQRSVVVTLTPKADSCSSPLPQSSSVTLGAAGTATASQVVALAERCVWEVGYQDVNDECQVAARLLDVADMPVSGTTTDDDGMLELTTRVRTSGSTPVATLEFENTCVAVVRLVNATLSTAHPSSNRGSVVVTVAPVATTECTDSAPTPASVTLAAMAAGSTAHEALQGLGGSECEWVLSYRNMGSDCIVEAQLKGTDGSPLTTPADTDGTISVFADTDRMLHSLASGGTAVGSVEFVVRSGTGDCDTTLPGMVEITVTDTEAGTHTGEIEVTLTSPTGRADCTDVTAGSPAISPVRVALTSQSITRAGTELTPVPVTLLDDPAGSGTACVYTVTFMSEVTVGSETFKLIAPADGTATLRTASPVVSATYDVVRDAKFSVNNATSTSAGHTGDTDRRDITVTVAPADPATPVSGCATTVAGSPFGIDAGDPAEEVDLGQDEGSAACPWKVTYQNTNDDCRVEPQLKAPEASDGTKANIDYTDADDNDGEFMLYVLGRRVRIGSTDTAAVVGSIDFNVPDPGAGGACNVVETAMVTVVVDDTDSGTHTDTEFTVTAAPVSVAGAHAVCAIAGSGTATATVEITAAAAASVMATANLSPALLMTHYSGTQCSYAVTFPGSQNSLGTGSTGVALVLDSTMPDSAVLNASTTSVTANYDALRAARLPVVNATAHDSSHNPTSRRTVLVTVAPAVSSCDSAPGNAATSVPAAAAAADATRSAVLGENACEWTLTFNNMGSDCETTAQLRRADGSGGNELFGSVVRSNASGNPAQGSLSVWVDANLDVRSASGAGGGSVVTGLVVTVTGTCETTFTGTVELTITDTEAASLSGMLEFGFAPADNTRSDCTAGDEVTVPLNKAASRAGELFPGTVNLIDDPLGPGEACSYEVTLPDSVTAGSLTLQRLSSDEEGTWSNTDADSRKVTARYDVERDAKFSVDNVTTGAHTSEGLTTRRNVTVEVAKSGTCATDNPDAVSDLTPAAAPATINLEQANCNWDVSYRNTNTDCKVVVTLKEPGTSAGTAGAAITGFADTSDGEFSLKTAGRRVVVSVPDGSGGTTDKVVGSAEFNVPDPLDSGSGGQCTTFFLGTASVTITDTLTPPGDHVGTTFEVTVAKQSGADDKCVTIDGMPAGVTLTVPTGQATASLTLPATPLAKKLVDLPYYPDKTVARCKYDVTFPADTNSVGVAGVTLKAPVDRTVELSNADADSRAASLTYDARRPARFDLVNVTGTSVAAHKVDDMEQVQVSVAPTTGTTCADTAPSGSPFTVEAGANNSPAVAAATVNVALGEADCSWTISYNNPNSDCEVTAMLKDDTDTDIPSSEFTYPAAAVEGSLTLHTVGRRLRIGSAADAKLVSAVELEVTGTCDTFFDGAVTLTITDTAPAALSGSLTLRLTPPTGRATECTDAKDVTVPLNQAASRAGVEFPATAAQLANLIDVPLGSTGGSCVYTVAFLKDHPVGTGPAALMLERVGNVATGTLSNANANSRQATASYDIKRDAVFALSNTTTATHTPASRSGVEVTLASVTPPGGQACAVSAPTIANPLAALAPAVTVNLEQADCTWQVSYNNVGSDCTVNVTLEGPAGAITSFTDTSDGEFLLYASGRRVRTEADGGGSVVTAVKFDVPSSPATTCITYFSPQVSISLAADSESGDHDGTQIPVTVSQQGTARDECSGTAIKQVELNSAGSGTVTFGGDDRLIDKPLGENECAYVVSFPASKASADTNTNLQLNRTTTGTINFTRSSLATTPLAATYRAVSSAVIRLKNITLANSTHPLDAMREVKVTVTPSGCSAQAPSGSPFTVAAASDVSVALGVEQCVWTLEFQNANADCLVTAQLRGADERSAVGSRVAPTSAAGGQVQINVDANRATLSGGTAGSGTAVSLVEFDVPTTSCTTVFEATLSVSVTDTANRNNPGVHARTAIPVTIRSQTTEPKCVVHGTDAGTTDRVTLTLGNDGMASATPKLVHVPHGQSANCRYEVTFPTRHNSQATGTPVLLNLGDATGVLAAGSGPSAASRRAVRVFDAERDAAITLRNVTQFTHNPADRSIVELTPTGDCAAASGTDQLTAKFSLPTSASPKTVTLGKTNCTWTLKFANTDDDCKVTAQVKDLNGVVLGSELSNRPTAGSVSLYVRGRRTMNDASAGFEAGFIDFAVENACDTIFDSTVSVQVENRVNTDDNHTGSKIDVRIEPAGGTGCTPTQNLTLTLNAQFAASQTVRLLNVPGGGTACSYTATFQGSAASTAGTQVRLVITTAERVPVSAGSPNASAKYFNEQIVTTPPLALSVASASPVTEGEPLVFSVSMPGRAPQQLQIGYALSGHSEVSNAAATGTVLIEMGQSSTVISIPTDDDNLDEAHQTVRVLLTRATGGVAISQSGRTAAGIVRDNDPHPTVGIDEAVIDGNRLRLTVELSTESGRDVRVNFTTDLGSDVIVVSAGQLRGEKSQQISQDRLEAGGSLRLRLTAAQNATIDVDNRERVLFPGGNQWQFHVVSRGRQTASELAAALGLDDDWKLYSWSAATQRWVEHTATLRATATLPVGTSITYRGLKPATATLEEAGLAPTSTLTLRQGWNIFTPAPAAVGLTYREFTSTDRGTSVFFDPRLSDCENLAGVLAIYTYDQADPQANNGFRLELPCHPQTAAQSGIPSIAGIDANDTVYVWFNNISPVDLEFIDGQYTP